jgi:transposase
MYEHFLFPDCRVEQVTRAGPEKVELAVRATRPEAACPTCLTPSHAIHSWYRRHPADLPGLGQAVCLNLSVRRFCCRNPACPRQTFAEPLPGLLNRQARRTQRLATAQAQVGIALGGEAGARLLQLVLKCELESRLRQAGVTWEWAEVIRGLDGLQQVEANLQGRRFLFRSHLQGHAAQALRVAGVAIPPTLRELA